jgi:hypothetical protein
MLDMGLTQPKGADGCISGCASRMLQLAIRVEMGLHFDYITFSFKFCYKKMIFKLRRNLKFLNYCMILKLQKKIDCFTSRLCFMYHDSQRFKTLQRTTYFKPGRP